MPQLCVCSQAKHKIAAWSRTKQKNCRKLNSIRVIFLSGSALGSSLAVTMDLHRSRAKCASGFPQPFGCRDCKMRLRSEWSMVVDWQIVRTFVTCVKATERQQKIFDLIKRRCVCNKCTKWMRACGRRALSDWAWQAAAVAAVYPTRTPIHILIPIQIDCAWRAAANCDKWGEYLQWSILMVSYEFVDCAASV